MLKKVFVVLLAFVFCLTLSSSAAFGAGKDEKCRNFLVAGSSWKIPPGQLKKMNNEALKNFSRLNIQVKEKAKKKKGKGKIKNEIKIKVKGKPFPSDLPLLLKKEER